jgi:hypothetical protein
MNPRRSLIRTSLVLAFAIAAATGCSQSTEQETGSTEGAQTATKGVPAVGEYQLEADNRSATLVVKAATASSITFDLEVFNNFGAYNQGFVTDATARGANGAYEHTSEDCKLSFKVTADSIEIAQDGICGMGNNVFANGTFKAKPPAPPVASLCSKTEEVIYSCKVAGSSKLISICGYKGAAQYRFGTAAKVDMKLPTKMGPVFDKPDVAEGGFISLAGPGGGGAFATFHNGDYDYTVLTMDSSKGLDAEGNSNGVENTSGVLVLKKGRRVAFVKCAEEATSSLPADIIAASRKDFDVLLLP